MTSAGLLSLSILENVCLKVFMLEHDLLWIERADAVTDIGKCGSKNAVFAAM